jgi:SAM-dependent methyltransferase
MNRHHLEMLASPRWAGILEEVMLPWITSNVVLGDDVLEIGPGPGLTTDLLRQFTPRLTAVEIDPSLAEPLAQRLAGTNVEVINANVLDTQFATGRFSATACFAVLHHVETVAVQDQIFRELHRVLRQRRNPTRPRR